MLYVLIGLIGFVIGSVLMWMINAVGADNTECYYLTKRTIEPAKMPPIRIDADRTLWKGEPHTKWLEDEDNKWNR